MAIKIKAQVNERQALSRLEELQAKINASVGNLKAYVGIFATAKYDDGTRVADVARANNFGTIAPNGARVPPRPFLTEAFRGAEGAVKLRRAFKIGLRRNMKTADNFPKAYCAAMEYMAQVAVGHVKRRISNASEWAVPNAPSTQRYKQEKANRNKPSSKKVTLEEANAPLRDTGVLMGAVSYKVK